MNPRITITVLTLILIVATAVFAQDDFNFRLAEHHAPLVHQDIGASFKGDLIARFDFDGDFIGNNNWENLDRHAVPAYVYYQVIETGTHYFISYVFFHPRDYDRVCIFGSCHENDTEGIILTIEKNGSEFGRFRLLETLAHDQIYTYANDKKIKKGSESIEGPAPLDEEGRCSIYIEPQGHGIWEWNDDILIDDPIGGTEIPRPGGTFLNDTGVIYYYDGRAEEPIHVNGRKASYALLPIWDEFWLRRNLVGNGSMFDKIFTYDGFRFGFDLPIPSALDGKTHAEDRAKAPWGWDDPNDGDVRKGDWFLDPAFAAGHHVRFPEEFSLNYVFNPYLD